MAIQGIGKIVIGVRDQRRAKEFWSEVVGFTVTTDVPTTTAVPGGSR